MKFGKNNGYKKCPRCGNKCLFHQSKCEECGLIFARLQFASNKAAKRKLRHFDKDFIIYTNQYPQDISYVKLLLYSIFFGLVGGHYYYCGKYVKGGLMTASFIYLIFCTVFNVQMVEYLESYYLYLPIGIAAFSWAVSIVYVGCRKFKVPVIVEMPSVDADLNLKKKDEINQVKEELKKENEKLKKQLKKENKNKEDEK